MVDSDKTRKLASRYLDLWLDHWERSARDPEMVDALARMVQETVSESADFHRRASHGLTALWPSMLAAPFGPWLETMQQDAATAQDGNETRRADKQGRQPARDTGPRDMGPRDTGPRDTGPRDTGAGRTDGATPAQPASGAGAERMAQLVQRIAELESRIEQLERPNRAAPRSSKRPPAGAKREP